MGIFLSSSIGFGATMNVDGTVDAGEYDIVSTDSDVGTEQFIPGGGSDIDTVSWGYDPATGFYHIAMKVKGPINTTGDGTSVFPSPTTVSLGLSQGGTPKFSLSAMMFDEKVINFRMWDVSGATPADVPLTKDLNLKYAVGPMALEIAIHGDKFAGLIANPFDFDLHFEGGGENEDDRIQGEVPEPTTMSMLLIGGLCAMKRRRRKTA